MCISFCDAMYLTTNEGHMATYRAMKGLPPEAKAGIAVSLKLLPLPAAVVGVEHEAALVIPFHQHLCICCLSIADMW